MTPEDRLLGVMRLEKERLQTQDQGIASLLDEAAAVIRTLTAEHHDAPMVVRNYLPDELEGSAILLRGRK